MHTPENRSHVRPALSHSLFVVYERGEAPGYGACSLAQPAVKAKMTTAMARALIGMTSFTSSLQVSEPCRVARPEKFCLYSPRHPAAFPRKNT